MIKHNQWNGNYRFYKLAKLYSWRKQINPLSGSLMIS